MYDLVVCIYTCREHASYLELFYKSPVYAYLASAPRTLILEVYADEVIPDSRLSGSQLVVRSEENYHRLCFKTLEMMRFCLARTEFAQLLKIDVTTVMTTFEGKAYQGRKPLDLAALTHFLQNASRATDYDGFVQLSNVARENVREWAAKKDTTVNLEFLFGDGDIPTFFSGKCYIVSRRFAEFVVAHGMPLAEKHAACGMGAAEDVMVGTLYAQYVAQTGFNA